MARTDKSHGTHSTTDHEEIRRWVEDRGGHPATVRGTGDDEEAGVLRIDFPGYSGRDRLEHISWDEFFQKFDEEKLEFIYQEEKSSGEQSNFSKFVRRGSGGSRHRAA
jgi:hypothetical protein